MSAPESGYSAGSVGNREVRLWTHLFWRGPTGSPSGRISLRRGGPPGLLECPLAACRGAAPRRTRFRLLLVFFEEIQGEVAMALAYGGTHRIRNEHRLPERTSTAHGLVYRRFADRVAEVGARLTVSSGEIRIPSGQQTKIQGVSVLAPIPIDPQSLVDWDSPCLGHSSERAAGLRASRQIGRLSALHRVHAPARIRAPSGFLRRWRGGA